MINVPREEGMKAFQEGLRFDQCPRQSLKQEDIDWRWEWQKGWLHAQLNKQDEERKHEQKEKTR